MNEELINQLGEAMKRREKARIGLARWQEQLDDANEDIQELSGRIAEYTATASDSDPQVEVEAEVETIYQQMDTDPYAPRIFEPVTE